MSRLSRSWATKTKAASTFTPPASKKAKSATSKPASKTPASSAKSATATATYSAKGSAKAKGKSKPKSKATVSSDEGEEDEKAATEAEESDEDEPLTFKEFSTQVKELKVVIGQAKGKDGLIDFVLQPKEFSTGSLGWSGNKNTKFPVGKRIRNITVTVNVVINNTKPEKAKGAASGAKSPLSAKKDMGKGKQAAASSRIKRKASESSLSEEDAGDDE